MECRPARRGHPPRPAGRRGVSPIGNLGVGPSISLSHCWRPLLVE
jgi:hypothetical protein